MATRQGCVKITNARQKQSMAKTQNRQSCCGQYRDNVLSKTAEGQELINSYYKFSPAVTELLERRPLLKNKAKMIIDNMLPGIRKKVQERFEIKVSDIMVNAVLILNSSLIQMKTMSACMLVEIC